MRKLDNRWAMLIKARARRKGWTRAATRGMAARAGIDICRNVGGPFDCDHARDLAQDAIAMQGDLLELQQLRDILWMRRLLLLVALGGSLLSAMVPLVYGPSAWSAAGSGWLILLGIQTRAVFINAAMRRHSGSGR